MDFLKDIAEIASCITGIAALIVLIVKPIRDRVLGLKRVQDGQKCLLRNDMLHTYYKNRDSKTIRQYEYENFLLEYDAYKALKGNSFIKKIKEEVTTWEVLT